MNNALYYDRLCMVKEREFEDPDDILIDAEHRKRELAEDQERHEQEPTVKEPQGPSTSSRREEVSG